MRDWLDAVLGDRAVTPTRCWFIRCLQARSSADAAASGTFVRASDDGGDELILFTCTGSPAVAFYDAVSRSSAQIGSAFEYVGRSFRSTAKVKRNLFGVDSCSAVDGADHHCVITFNAGDFLDP